MHNIRPLPWPFLYASLLLNLSLLGNIHVSLFGKPLYLVEIFLLCLGAFFLFSRHQIHVIHRPILFGQGLILLGLLSGLLLLPSTPHGWGIFKSWFCFPFLATWLGWHFVRTPREREHFLLGWLTTLTFVSGISLGFWLIGDLTYDGRLHSFFLSPNALALFLFPAPLISLYLLIVQPSWRVWLWPSLGLNLFILSLTFSYTVWISVILGSLLFLRLQYPHLISYKKILLILICLSALFIVTQWHQPKFQNWFSMPERSSLASRIIIWEVSLHLLREHPWLGIGPGNFQQSYLNAQLFFPPYLEWAVPHPHQLYLAFWLESGLLGLIGFLFIIHYTLMRLWRASKEKTSGMLPMLLLSLLTALLLQGFFDTPYFSLPLAYLFWCILLLL